MKKTAIMGLVAVLGTAVVQADIYLTTTNGVTSGGDTTATFTNLTGNPLAYSMNNGCYALPINLSLTGASGSFTMRIQAFSNINASAWSYDAAHPKSFIGNATGWGVSGGANNIIDGTDGHLFTFNLNGLTLSPGLTLGFRIGSSAGDNSCAIYEQTGASSGVAAWHYSLANTSWVLLDGYQSSPNVYQFFLVRDKANFRLTSVTIDAIPEQSIVPDMLGLSQPDAEAAVNNAGLVVGTVLEAYSDTVTTGLVISQDPAGGASVAKGSAVDLTVSLGHKPLQWLQHLDATNAASVVVTGNTVLQWLDLTTNGNDAVAGAGTVLYPSASLSKSGLAGLDFGSAGNTLELFSSAASDAWLDQSSNTNGFCVLAAFKCDALVPGVDNDVVGNSTNSASGFGLRYTQTGEIQAFSGGELVGSPGRHVEPGDTVVLAFDYDAASGACVLWESKDGTSTTGNVAHADFSTAAPVVLGGRFSGMVGEVKVFGEHLGSFDFVDQRATLVQKWIKRPNIVFFYVDDWAWNGSSVRMDDRMRNSAMPAFMEMPNFDALASAGMVFRNAYGSPQCATARACIQTGQTSPRNGLTVTLGNTNYYDTRASYAGGPVVPNGANDTLDPDAYAIPERLNPLGYVCAHFGKWHLDSDPAIEGYAESDGKTNNDQGNTYDSATGMEGLTDPKLMTHVTSSGLDFMERQVAAGRPFYLQLSQYAMHAGHECFPSSRARYQNIPEIVAYNGGATNPASIDRNSDPAVWLGMGYEIDQKLGEVLQKIHDLGIADNTYVIVMGDNGYRNEFYSQIAGLPQPLHAAKWWIWQAGVRVPMIVKGPDIQPGSYCTANVVNYDFMPTFFDWAGGDTNELTGIDGVSLAGLMRGETPSEGFLNRSLYFHYPHYRTSMPTSMIVKGHEKVMYFYETPVTHPSWEPIMYFDLASDVGEYRNIYPENPARAHELYADLTNYLAKVGARIPLVPNPDYDPTNYVELSWGPFIGTRTPDADEVGPTTFADYWLDSLGVDLGGYAGDYDNDGVPNLLEYALGGDPTNGADHGASPLFARNGGAFNYSHVQRSDDSRLRYSVETTTNLVEGIWSQDPAMISTTNGNGSVLDNVENLLPATNGQTYIRMKVEQLSY